MVDRISVQNIMIDKLEKRVNKVTLFQSDNGNVTATKRPTITFTRLHTCTNSRFSPFSHVDWHSFLQNV